jgi:putative sterol carrier protein
MTFKLIFNEIKKAMLTADASTVKDFLAIQITLTGLGGGTFYVEVKNGALSVEPYDYNDRNAALTISVGDFKKLADGKLDAIEAFNQGKLKVDGSVEKALEFSELMKTVKR